MLLRRRAVAVRFVPPISLVLLANAGSYVEGLTRDREGTVAEWSARFAHALRDSTVLVARLGSDLALLQASWREAAGRPRRTSATQRLTDLLASRPVLDIPGVAELLGVSYPQARDAVLRLEEAAVLRPVTIGQRRNRAWEVPSLLALLDDFAFEAMTPTQPRQRRRASPGKAPRPEA